MKLILPALVFVLFCHLNEVASANDEVAVRTLLSHGHQVGSNTCSDNEWTTIVDTVENQANRRNLRKGSDEDRALWRIVPSYCEAICSGFSPGMCFMVYYTCIGYYPRRDLANTFEESSEQNVSQQPASSLDEVPKMRELASTDAACKAKVNRINASLDALYPRMSNSCKRVLDESRDFTCYSTVSFDIEKFRLWDGNTNKVIDHGFSRWKETVCASQNVNFEAVVGDVVNEIAFTLTGNNGFKSSNTDTGGPFLSFGDNGRGDVYGKKLTVGKYTLTATPDGEASRTQTAVFRVIDC